MKELFVILNELERLLATDHPIAMATVIYVEGSAYRRPGARMLIDHEGNWWGGISGGCLEGDLLRKATYAMMEQKIVEIAYDTRGDDPFELGVGLGCQGLIKLIIDPIRDHIELIYKHLRQQTELGHAFTLRSAWDIDATLFELSHPDQASKLPIQFIEQIPARPRLWVVGNQFDACSLILLAEQLAWEVHWVGNPLKMRKDLKGRVFKTYAWDEVLTLRKSDFVVMMTHDLDRDTEFFQLNHGQLSVAYLGMLGPLSRFDRFTKQLNVLGVYLPSDLVAAPIGLDIGAEGPEEIAIAIVAEILCVKSNRNGGQLKHRLGTIHGENDSIRKIKE